MASRRSEDLLVGDGAHLANEHLGDTWQAPLGRDIKGQHRSIRTILKYAPISWQKLRGFAALSPQTATLADISWRHVMAQTWELAFKECDIHSGVLSPAVAIESWKMILETLDLNTMDGLHRYVYRWVRDDYVIERIDGSYVLIHPGTRSSSSAKPRYFQPGGLQGELRNA